MTDDTSRPLERAYQSPAFPGNAIPFARRLAELVSEQGTAAIKSDDARALLWILMAQSYGQAATIDLGDEWKRLRDAHRDESSLVQTLKEIREEISVVNRAAGHTVFNPASTDFLNEEIRQRSGLEWDAESKKWHRH